MATQSCLTHSIWVEQVKMLQSFENMEDVSLRRNEHPEVRYGEELKLSYAAQSEGPGSGFGLNKR